MVFSPINFASFSRRVSHANYSSCEKIQARGSWIGEVDLPIFLSGRNAGLALAATSNTSFKNHLLTAGKLSQSFNPSKDIYVAMDLDAKTIREMSTLGVSPKNAILLRFEPAIVCPLNFSTRAERLFSRILDVGRQTQREKNWEYWPQNWSDSFNSLLVTRPKSRIDSRLVLINANKLSLIKNEQYSFRRHLIHSFPIDTFGPNWDSGLAQRLRTLAAEVIISLVNGYIPRLRSLRFWLKKHPSLQGLSDDKLETLAKYRTAVVVENSPEYLSEKLFDAIFAGCIPIYVGPKVEDFGIPAGLVVQTLPNVQAFDSAVAKANRIDYGRWCAEREVFLTNPSTKERWASESVFDRIILKIEATF
jgi:hypothetical protein